MESDGSRKLRASAKRGDVMCSWSRRATVLIILSLLPMLSIGMGLIGSTADAAPVPSPFGVPVRVNDYTLNEQGLPVMIKLPDDELFVAWQDARSGTEDIYTSTSRDNGVTFSPSKRADDSFGSSRQIEPSVAVSPNGTIMLAWQDNRRSTIDYDIYFTRSFDDGSKFARNAKIDDSGSAISWQERPSIAVTSRGVVYVAWTDDRTGFLRVRGAYSTDGGATFSASSEVVQTSGASGQTGVVVAATDNRIFVAFMDNLTGAPHPYFCMSTDGGRSFSAPTRFDGTAGTGAVQRGISIAPMPDGGIVAVWEDSRNGGWDLYAAVVSKTGSITTPAFRVDDDTTGAYQRNACVTSDQVGNIYVAWEDERNNLFAVRFAYAEAKSTQFSASVEISGPGPLDVQRRPSVVVTEPGKVFVAWQDDRAGTYDIYSCAGYVPNLLSLHIDSSWNFVSIYVGGYSYNASTLGLAFGDVVVGWNPSTQAYDKTYIVGLSPSVYDFPILPNTGYWIYASVDEKLVLQGNVPKSGQSEEINVPEDGGWAIVSFASLNMTRYASDVPRMYSVPGSLTCVVGYDASTETYSAYITGVPSTDFPLVPGKAYWCWATVSGVFSYEP